LDIRIRQPYTDRSKSLEHNLSPVPSVRKFKEILRIFNATYLKKDVPASQGYVHHDPSFYDGNKIII